MEFCYVIRVRSSDNAIVSAARIKRLAKHVDGRVGVVKKAHPDGSLDVLPIRPEFPNEPMDTSELWMSGDVSNPFATPDEQPGAHVEPGMAHVRLSDAEFGNKVVVPGRGWALTHDNGSPRLKYEAGAVAELPVGTVEIVPERT